MCKHASSSNRLVVVDWFSTTMVLSPLYSISFGKVSDGEAHCFAGRPLGEEFAVLVYRGL